MQALGVVSRLWPDLDSGAKRSTIRWREPRIAPGPLRYLCDDGSGRSMIVEVRDVSDMELRGVAEFLGMTDEWPDPVLLEEMREHYPAISLADIVQVIRHGPPG